MVAQLSITSLYATGSLMWSFAILASFTSHWQDADNRAGSFNFTVENHID